MIRLSGRAAAPLVASLLLAGCGTQGIGFSDLVPSIGAPEPSGEESIYAVWRRDVTLTITGELVGLEGRFDSGVECASVRTEDGRLFSVIGSVDRYEVGQTLEISGPLALWSTCATYQVIRADRVTARPMS